jgi:hypothetical protein
MALTTFQGPVRSLNGFYTQGPGNTITLGATATLTVAAHAGRILLVPATCAIILPAVNASANPATSGPGSDPNTLNNIGAIFTFIFTAASAGATAQTITTTGSDVYTGQISVAGTTSQSFNSTAGTVITLNSTTSGGAAAGSRLSLMPYTAGKYMVIHGSFVGSGTVVTPFS